MILRRVAVGICASGLTLAAMPALDGPGALAQQDPLPPPNQVAPPHETIQQLDAEVGNLTDLRVLNAGQGRSLEVKLEQASDSLMIGDPDAVLRPLNAFSREVAALTRARVLGGKDALILESLTAQSIAGVRSAQTVPFVEPLFQPCPSPGPCAPLVLWVDPKARSGGDGSSDAPFRRIADALAAADNATACGVEIVLEAGTYRESIELTRATRLRGAGSARPVIMGSVLDYGGFDLRISGIDFEDSPAPGAVVVDSLCGPSIEIMGVGIRDAAHHGIHQRRGALRIVGLDVRGTAPDPTDPETGTAIRLSDGV